MTKYTGNKDEGLASVGYSSPGNLNRKVTEL